MLYLPLEVRKRRLWAVARVGPIELDSPFGSRKDAKSQKPAPIIEPSVKKTHAKPEAFVYVGIRLARERGYPNAGFIQARNRYGTIEAITRPGTSGEIKRGLVRMVAIGLADWTTDAAVGRFPECFRADVREAANWRLGEALARHSRASIAGGMES